MKYAILSALLLASCGKNKDQDFDVQAYCTGEVECRKDFINDYAAPADRTDTGGYGYTYEYTVDQCVDGWEVQQVYYADLGCSAEFNELEQCLANEELSCLYGSYSSAECLSVTLDMVTCLQAGMQATLSDTGAAY